MQDAKATVVGPSKELGRCRYLIQICMSDIWLPSDVQVEQIKPVAGMILIAPHEREAVSQFIIDPELHKLEGYRGCVLAVADDISEDIRPGDEIMFAPYSHRSLDLNGNTLFVVHWSDVLAFVAAHDPRCEHPDCDIKF